MAPGPRADNAGLYVDGFSVTGGEQSRAAGRPGADAPLVARPLHPAQGAIVTEESAAALQALVPQLRIAHIPQAGHNIRRDQFDRYMEVVRASLAEWVATAAS